MTSHGEFGPFGEVCELHYGVPLVEERDFEKEKLGENEKEVLSVMVAVGGEGCGRGLWEGRECEGENEGDN